MQSADVDDKRLHGSKYQDLNPKSCVRAPVTPPWTCQTLTCAILLRINLLVTNLKQNKDKDQKFGRKSEVSSEVHKEIKKLLERQTLGPRLTKQVV